MRIQIVKKLTPQSIDTRWDRFRPGFQYEVNSALGRLLIAEGWAQLAGVGEAAVRGVRPADGGYNADEHSATQQDLPGALASLNDAFAADIAFDDAIAAAIERQALNRARS